MKEKLIELKILCSTNDKYEKQKPIFTICEDNKVLFTTVDLLEALQATLNRVI
jgi:hypothetical protein